MAIFSKKDGGKGKMAAKPMAKSSSAAPKAEVRVMKSKLTRSVKEVPTTRVPVSKLTRSVKEVRVPKMASDTIKSKPPMGLIMKSKSVSDTTKSTPIKLSSGATISGKSFKKSKPSSKSGMIMMRPGQTRPDNM